MNLTWLQGKKPTDVDTFAYTNGENMRPQPFEAIFEPRTPQIRELLLSEYEVSRERLRQYDGDTKVKIENYS